jgi:hypothetical protein
MGKLRTEFQMSSDTLNGEEIPLLPEEDAGNSFPKQIKRAVDQLALDRNFRLMDSIIKEKWPMAADT